MIFDIVSNKFIQIFADDEPFIANSTDDAWD